MQVRRASDRGRGDYVWTRSAHSFSFGAYYDVRHQGAGALLVLNDDLIAPGQQSTLHGHRDVEIVSVVVQGHLKHRHRLPAPSAAGAPGEFEGTLPPGGVQVISAGAGLDHAEGNAGADEEARIIQMWFKPVSRGGTPSYRSRGPQASDGLGHLVPVVSFHEHPGALPMNADATVHLGHLNGGEVSHITVNEGRQVYVQVTGGTLEVNDVRLSDGDGALVDVPGRVVFSNGDTAKFLVIEVSRQG